MYYNVLLPLAFDSTFTYKSEEELNVGQIVKVPFTSKTYLGVVIEVTPPPGFIDKVKDIITPYPYSINDKRLSFLNFMATYNMIPKGNILKMMLPLSKCFERNTLSLQQQELKDEFTLSSAQQKIADEIISADDAIFLIKGVTGSGKTEVYLKIAIDAIQQGRQVLILLPEIFLTSQLISRFFERLGFEPLEWHSNLTKKQKEESFMRIINNEAKLVVGARSALFLPFKDLALIIVDEEHDASYKQEEGNIYNARDMAITLAKHIHAKCVLCSATPSLESIHNARSGKYKALYLPSRFSNVELPIIKVVDANQENHKIITKALQIEIQSTLAMGKQALLFINRRGYCPISVCKHCGAKISCRNCNTYLVYHKAKLRLRCHLCDFNISVPSCCQVCMEKSDFVQLGIGIEKVAEEVIAFAPKARISLLSSDTMLNKAKIECELTRINNQEVDIIIGTQLITKGLHFSNLHLVGVIDADGAMLGNDIRAVEKTYQIIQQVAGRAGREQKRGIVILQSRSPTSTVMQSLKDYNEDAFIQAELDSRREANMPPFSRLASIIVSSKKEILAIKVIGQLQRYMPKLDSLQVLGPSPAPMFYLRNRYRYRFVLVAKKHCNIQYIIKTWLANMIIPSAVTVKIDIDPYSFF